MRHNVAVNADAALALHLPTGWSAAPPESSDVGRLAALRRSHEAAIRGWATATDADVFAEVAEPGGRRRRHVHVIDRSGRVRAWANVHDRAAGRVNVEVLVDPELSQRPDHSDAAALAEGLFRWADDAATAIGVRRGLALTQLDSSAFADDQRQQQWLTAAGYVKARTWWQMSRPVTAAEGEPGALAPPRPGVVVRRVVGNDDAMPDEGDVRTVHAVLETSFADHFNSHQETFDEFCARLREDPGHRWDHWWIAELTDQDRAEVAGALVGAVLPARSSPTGDSQREGSYIAYMGVLPNARGRGVARSLLAAVITDAARRGRNRVDLEVDADSPTGAEAMYAAMGWQTSYVTQSWHRDLPLPT